MQGPPGLGEIATLVITDIQSSSKLWELMPDAFCSDLKKHDRLLRHMMLLYNGREVCTEGDSFQVRLFCDRAAPLCRHRAVFDRSPRLA